MAKRTRKTTVVARSPVAPVALAPAHDAAGSGRRLRGWMPTAAGPNRVNTGAASLRNRARDAARNDWAGRAIPQRWASNLVGTGIIARPKTKDAALKQTLVDLWDDWLEVCDADGVLDGYGQQNMVAHNWIQSGEVFIRLRPRRPEDGLPVPLQMQVLESDMVPAADSMAPNGNTILQGIEFNAFGQRVAYHMLRNHPGDGIGDTSTTVRVPAEFVIHVYEPTRPGQLRGVSELAPILARLRGVGDFDDAVLERQKIANLFTGFLEKPPSSTDQTLDPVTGKSIIADADGTPMASMEPGTVQELLPGESMKFSAPPDAGAGYGDFTRQQYMGVAAGSGLPYELLSGDLREVSDRALRVILTEFRRHCQQRQWHILIPQFCRKVRNAWADAAVLGGVLTAAEAREAKRVTWVPQGWAYIHPTQDVQAKKMEVEAGLNSRSRIITERGDDPDEIDAERAADELREINLGLVDEAADPEDDPLMLAAADKARAERDVENARARLLAVQAAREKDESRATVSRIAADAERARAETEFLTAKTHDIEAASALRDAESAAASARVAAESAEALASAARADNESAARLALLNEQAAAARRDADARNEAFAKAEEFAAEQRAVVLGIERARAATVALEHQAAQLGLEELRGAR